MRRDQTLTELTSKIGSLVGTSDWLEIDQERIDTFADATLDQQFIHTDPERAKSQTPFGGTIAHGFLSLSLLTHLFQSSLKPPEGAILYLNYGFNKIRFLMPVPAGGSIRAKIELKSMEPKGDTALISTYSITLELKGHDKPALVAEWLTLTEFAS